MGTRIREDTGGEAGWVVWEPPLRIGLQHWRQLHVKGLYSK